MRPSGLLLGLRATVARRLGTPVAAVVLVLVLASSTGASVPRVVIAAHLPPPPGTTSLVSVRFGDGVAGGPSAEPSISANGRYVAFTSLAPDLVQGDTNQASDVFLRDRQAGTTVRIPLPGGAPVPPGGRAYEPSISANGRVVAFTFAPSAFRSTVVAGSVVLAWDRVTGQTTIISPTGSGAGAASQATVSTDGRYIAFTSTSDRLHRLDFNERADIFRHDRQTGETVAVSITPEGRTGEGESGRPAISGNGRYVAFDSTAGDLAPLSHGVGLQVYLRDMQTGTTERISAPRDPFTSEPDGESERPAISANGRYVAFESLAGNLVEGDDNGEQDVFVRDRATGTTSLVSVAADGGPADDGSSQAALSRDGRFVAFVSNATDLVTLEPGAQLRGAAEVYARDLVAGETILVSVTLGGLRSGALNAGPVIGGGGRYVAWASLADDLVAGDTNEQADVFLRDLPPVPIVTPPVLEFGARAVGTTAPPAAATLTNGGWGPLRPDGAAIAGTHASDFAVLFDGCTEIVLFRTDACTVTVGYLPSAAGDRTASLRIADDFTGSPRTVRLRGGATLAELEVDPPLGRPGIVTIATGRGFPPNTPVRLEWAPGITPRMPDLVTDAEGGFRVQVLVFHRDVIGERELVASPLDDGAFPPVEARFLVIAGTVQPPGFSVLRGQLDLPAALMDRR